MINFGAVQKGKQMKNSNHGKPWTKEGVYDTWLDANKAAIEFSYRNGFAGSNEYDVKIHRSGEGGSKFTVKYRKK